MSGEQRILIDGVGWKEYLLVREALDTPGLRMTYLRGMLEISRPSFVHALYTKTISRLIELYAFCASCR